MSNSDGYKGGSGSSGCGKTLNLINAAGKAHCAS